jgi:hypothetical protein
MQTSETVIGGITVTKQCVRHEVASGVQVAPQVCRGVSTTTKCVHHRFQRAVVSTACLKVAVARNAFRRVVTGVRLPLLAFHGVSTTPTYRWVVSYALLRFQMQSELTAIQNPE